MDNAQERGLGGDDVSYCWNRYHYWFTSSKEMTEAKKTEFKAHMKKYFGFYSQNALDKTVEWVDQYLADQVISYKENL